VLGDSEKVPKVPDRFADARRTSGAISDVHVTADGETSVSAVPMNRTELPGTMV
jgi:hypothetical protein